MNPGSKVPTAFKKLIPLLALVLSIIASPALRAQVRLGVIGGLHTANVQESNKLSGPDTLKRFQSGRSGFQLGFILELPLGHKGFFFQPAITYSSKGRKYTRNNDSATSLLND